MAQNKISIIGLGWLGLPLYHKLVALNYSCKGSTTSLSKKKELQSQGITAYQAALNETGIIGNIIECLEDSKILILNIPPGLRRNPDSNYVAKIEKLLHYVEKSSIEKVLYISSTSVFEDEEHLPKILNTTETNASSNAGKQLRKVEELFRNNTAFETTILRFSGLVDERRHPVTMMSKRPIVGNPYAPVNLIHREDCIAIIIKILSQEAWDKTFNASYPLNKTKYDYYKEVCNRLNLREPNFDREKPSKGKKIDGSETGKMLKYTYKYLV